MKALLLRFFKDDSGNGAVSQAVLIAGGALLIIPTVQNVGAKLVEAFAKITQALH